MSRAHIKRLYGESRVAAVLGAQWGDEGKGKIVDTLTAEANLVIRYGGGANAGHTIFVNGRKVVTHIIPSGAIRPNTLNIIGPGVACGLDVLSKEVKEVADVSGSRVVIDRSTPIVHPIHRWFDVAREANGGGIGTTQRGIGPAYEDMFSRRGSVRAADLLNPDKIEAALTAGGYYAERRAAAESYLASNVKLPAFPSLTDVVADLMQYREFVRPRLADTREIVWEAVEKRQCILFEGAQGVMLDVFNGSSPHTTSSLCGAAGIRATYGNLPITSVIGVAKAYATRVGGGPFPTELKGPEGDLLRELGNEYGATTGRPRRCGWLDLVALRYAVRMGEITHLVVTKLDTLVEFATKQGLPTPLGVHYNFELRRIGRNETLTSRVQRDSVVEYDLHSLPSSVLDESSALHPSVSSYLKRIQDAAGVPIAAVGTGPERDQLIFL